MSDRKTGGERVPNLTRIILIDDDPIFRLGLRTALEAFPDLQVVAEADTGAVALNTLSTLLRQNHVDLVALEMLLGHSNPNELSGLPLCQRLKAQYPNLPVLLLTAQSDPVQLVAAKESGIEGYCAKRCSIPQIIQAMRQLVMGQSSWPTLPTLPPALTKTVRPPSWHSKLRSHGLRQIEDTLAQVTQQLQNPNLSNLDWLFWSGRRRELLAARWVVNQLLPTDVIIVEKQPSNASGLPTNLPPAREETSRQLPPTSGTAPTSPLSRIPQQSTPFDATVAKLQSGLSNLSGVVLEIDILKTEKRRHLLDVVLQKFKDILEELRLSEVTLEQLPQKRSLILQDLWQVSVTEFLGKYYTLLIENQEIEVVNVVLQYKGIVQYAILDKIPLVVELLSHQLFETPLKIDNVSYPARTPEAISRSEIILQNLIIQVSNAVLQPLLNEFADVEEIKQNFYDRHLISSREITRFRNNLSWKYRLTELLSEPQAIFESRYNLFFLSDTGIKQTSIYAPRREELEQLRGIPVAVTLAYELRDAIAPRLRATVAWVGRGVVYILTQVLGRSIGLVVRGVLQGIGSSIQDTRFGKNGERGK
jgi:DNA-binding NarL/FixJ family response regulator